MVKAIELPYPPRWINAYIVDQLSAYEDINVSNNSVGYLSPILTSTPSNTEEIYKQLLQTTSVGQPLLIQYDRLMRFRPNTFYATKREQLLYYLYSTSLENVNNAMIVISQLLDREDAAAQDLNSWASNNPQSINEEQIPHNVFFHNIKAYQADETRDLVDLASARAVYVNKIIIEYDYHSNWSNTTVPAGQNLT
jgi:hypothetical protein